MMTMNRRAAIGRAAALVGAAAPLAAAASPALAADLAAPLPPFPTPGLSVGETLARLIAWEGGPAAAADTLLASLHNGHSFEATEQYEAVRARIERLRRHIEEHWDQTAGHAEATAAACAHYGYRTELDDE